MRSFICQDSKAGQAEIAILFVVIIILAIFISSILQKKLLTKIKLEEGSHIKLNE